MTIDPKTERQGDVATIKEVDINGPFWLLLIMRGKERVYSATCHDLEEAEEKRDLWVAGAPVDVIDYGPTRERVRWLDGKS